MAYVITESNFDNILAEEKNKELYVTGVFSSFGKRNNNDRVYTENVLKREVTKVNEKIGKKCLWGELGHPPNPEINPGNIAILVEGLEWKNDDLYGKARVLNTPNGQIAKELIKSGTIGISSRGLGTVSEDGTVNEDYNLITWDLVTDPSNGPSWVNGIYEGKEYKIEEIKDDEKDDALEEAKAKLQEKYGITVIEGKTDEDIIRQYLYESRMEYLKKLIK